MSTDGNEKYAAGLFMLDEGSGYPVTMAGPDKASPGLGHFARGLAQLIAPTRHNVVRLRCDGDPAALDLARSRPRATRPRAL